MKKMVFEIPVGKIPAKKKRWWQFWRKKGDSAEEVLAAILRMTRIENIFKK